MSPFFIFVLYIIVFSVQLFAKKVCIGTLALLLPTFTSLLTMYNNNNFHYADDIIFDASAEKQCHKD